MMFLFGSSLPRMIETLFQNTFFGCLMFFWIAFFHGIRQTSRTVAKFYAPKALMLATFLFTIAYTSCWSQRVRLERPTLDELDAFQSSPMLRGCSFLFYVTFVSYFLYLAGLMLAAFTELRAMPYFDLRLKLQAFLISFTMLISALIVLISTPAPSPVTSTYTSDESDNEISRVPFLQLLPWTYTMSSSAAFLALFSIANLYVFFCAYFYYPSNASLMDTRLVRDNPTLSMINDSDEDVIYGSDTEQPLTTHQPKLIDTPDDGEESD